MSDPVPTPAPTPTPEPEGPLTSFEGLTVKARRIPNSDLSSGRWELYVEAGGVPWVFASRKLGGFDDDLQEKATPGFKEARAQRYANETGRPRLEPGPGA